MPKKPETVSAKRVENVIFLIYAFLATDHAGFELKEKVKLFLQQANVEFTDCGATAFNKDDDYPDFISLAAEAVSKDPTSRAIIFGGSGQGEAIVANKFKNVRAVVFYGPVIPAHGVDVSGRISEDLFEMVRLTREHNDSNILSIGAKFIKEEDAKRAIRLWMETKFNGEPRHSRRIAKIKVLEEKLDK